MDDAILVEKLTKIYQVPEREGGFRSAVGGFFKRKYRDVHAVPNRRPHTGCHPYGYRSPQRVDAGRQRQLRFWRSAELVGQLRRRIRLRRS